MALRIIVCGDKSLKKKAIIAAMIHDCNNFDFLKTEFKLQIVMPKLMIS